MWLTLLGPPRQLRAAELGGKIENYSASLDEHPIDTGRMRRVLERVAAASQFVGGHVGSADGHAFGLAAHRSFLSYVAVVAKCSARVDRPFGVDEVWVAIDAGQVINRDRVRAQMEGTVVLEATVDETGTVKDARVLR